MVDQIMIMSNQIRMVIGVNRRNQAYRTVNRYHVASCAQQAQLRSSPAADQAWPVVHCSCSPPLAPYNVMYMTLYVYVRLVCNCNVMALYVCACMAPAPAPLYYLQFGLQ